MQRGKTNKTQMAQRDIILELGIGVTADEIEDRKKKGQKCDRERGKTERREMLLLPLLLQLLASVVEHLLSLLRGTTFPVVPVLEVLTETRIRTQHAMPICDLGPGSICRDCRNRSPDFKVGQSLG